MDQSVAAQVYDIDHFTTDAGTIAALHARGRNVVCYFSAGSSEPYHPDSGQFPAAVRGKPIGGFADEQWLDIRQLDTLGSIIRARFDRARGRGCDQLTFNRWLALEAHQRGLAVFLKNNGDQANALAADFDGAVVEQSFEYDECEAYLPFIRASKPIFEIEYNVSPEAFCDPTTAFGFSSLFKHLALDAYRINLPREAGS